MDKLLQTLIAFFTALSAALGGPANTGNVPDRPAIVAPTPAPISVESTPPEATEIEISGVVQGVHDGTLVVSGITIFYGSQTQVNGQLQVGARVRVEGLKRGNDIQAKEIHVTDDGKSSQASGSRTSSGSSTSAQSSSSETSKASSSHSSTSSTSEASHSSSSEGSQTSSKASSSASSSESSDDDDSSSSESSKGSSKSSSGGSSSSRSSEGSRSSSSSSNK